MDLCACVFNKLEIKFKNLGQVSITFYFFRCSLFSKLDQ
jgi:hypothetical protein